MGEDLEDLFLIYGKNTKLQCDIVKKWRPLMYNTLHCKA